MPWGISRTTYFVKTKNIPYWQYGILLYLAFVVLLGFGCPKDSIGVSLPCAFCSLFNKNSRRAFTPNGCAITLIFSIFSRLVSAFCKRAFIVSSTCPTEHVEQRALPRRLRGYAAHCQPERVCRAGSFTTPPKNCNPQRHTCALYTPALKKYLMRFYCFLGCFLKGNAYENSYALPRNPHGMCGASHLAGCMAFVSHTLPIVVVSIPASPLN